MKHFDGALFLGLGAISACLLAVACGDASSDTAALHVETPSQVPQTTSQQQAICPEGGLPPAEYHPEWPDGCKPVEQPPEGELISDPGYGELISCEARVEFEWVPTSSSGTRLVSPSGDFSVRIRNNRAITLPVIIFAQHNRRFIRI